MTQQAIITAYQKAGLLIEKIRRARLNDGWYVYHPFAMAHKVYKPLKYIKDNPDGSKLYQRQCDWIKTDWIEDNNQDMLEMHIQEALNRKGR